MTQTRRQFIALSLAAATAARLAPTIAARAGSRRVLTLVYDKGLGMMRAVDRVLP
ncbi:Tat pathway signal protein [Gymnodinialimonas sp.]